MEKLLLTGLLVFAGRGTIFQCVGACFVAIVFLFLHARTWPYEERNSNVLRAFAEAQLCIMLLISIALRADIGKDIVSDDGYGAILVVNLFMAPSVWAVMTAWQVYGSCVAKIRSTRDKPALEPQQEDQSPVQPGPEAGEAPPSNDTQKLAEPTPQP